MNSIIETEIGEDVNQMLPNAGMVTWVVDQFDP
jgi:hypothetical protein